MNSVFDPDLDPDPHPNPKREEKLPNPNDCNPTLRSGTREETSVPNSVILSPNPNSVILP